MSHQPVSEAALLTAGTKAPGFQLRIAPDEYISLEELRGRPVVLAFYPADWSPVCGDQMTLYSELRSEFDRLNAAVFGISVDGPWCHMAFAESRNLQLSLLSDFEPKGEVARLFGAYLKDKGTSGRALFVIDGDGVIRWSHLSPEEVNPGADGILEALEQLASTEASLGRVLT